MLRVTERLLITNLPTLIVISLWEPLSGLNIMQIPNGIGFVLGTIQLIIYAIYMNSKASQSSKETAASPLLASNQHQGEAEASSHV